MRDTPDKITDVSEPGQHGRLRRLLPSRKPSQCEPSKREPQQCEPSQCGPSQCAQPQAAAKPRARLERLLTRHNQRLWYILTILFAALSICDVVTGVFPLPVSLILYLCAAVSFFSSCALWIRTVRSLIRLALIPYTHSNRLIRRFIRDYRMQTVLLTLPGLVMDILFALFNAVLGIRTGNAWNGSLAAYYLLLCIMRLIAVMYAKGIYLDKKVQGELAREAKLCVSCGALLSVMSVALCGVTILLRNGVGGKSYPGYLIYLVALYTFWKLISSVKNMVKARKERSLLAIVLRNIGHTDSLVSLLYLQTAMVSAFGEPGDAFSLTVNTITGIAVSLSALFIGIATIHTGARAKKEMDTAA